MTFEVGTTNNSSSDYTPVTLTFANVDVAGYVTVSAIAGNIGSSNLVPTVDVNWSVGDDGILNFDTCSATFTFPASDNTGGTPMAVSEYDGTNWSYPTVGTQNSTNVQAIGLTSFGATATPSYFQLGQDTVAPTANITTPLDMVNSVNVGSESLYSITVTFSDNVAVDVGTVETSSLSVQGGPNNFTANFVSLDTNSNGTPRTALYQFTHDWISDDDGIYTVYSPTSVTDTAGNPVADDPLGTFAVYLTAPTVVEVDPTVPTITDAQFGDLFQLLITYSHFMDTSIDPTVTFSPDISSTLNPDAVYSGWSDPTTFYIAGYDVALSGAYVPNITVSVTGAEDLAGNPQDVYLNKPAGFTIDTVSPTVTSITSSAP